MLALSAGDIGSALPLGPIFSVHFSRTMLGAPLQTARNLVPPCTFKPPSTMAPPALDTSLTVSIIFRSEEKGTSTTRGYFSTSASWRPTFLAATTMGASEELPLGSHVFTCVSGSSTWFSFVLEHISAAKSVEMTPSSLLASAPVSFLVNLPMLGSKPLPATLYSVPADHIFTIVILPSVSVPVLSLQITDAEPSVSTAAIFFTRTFSLLAICWQPRVREMVTQSGMPSGMAATARVTAMRIM
mmetsp:Transcript_5562/g.15792  ORF Transcript_5562/g.15792 Transcript_5562/m.15792 type:complete len:243 (-) Transcript_5562:1174-1902(-)